MRAVGETRRSLTLALGLSSLLLGSAAYALPCPYAQPVGLIGQAQSVGNHAIGIDVDSGYAYVGDWHQGSFHTYAGVLQVLDVTDPCNPTMLGWAETTTPGWNEIGDLAVHGGRAFLANDANGFAVYDVSDPAIPVLDSYHAPPHGGYAHSVFFDGGQYAWVGYGWADYLAIYDVTQVTTPPVVYHTGQNGVHDVFVVGPRAYVYAGQQFIILDVQNPLQPALISSVPLPENVHGVAGEVRVQGNFAYLAMGDSTHLGGLRVVDITDEQNPVLAASYDLQLGNMFAKGVGLAVAEDHAYVAGTSGLHVFNVSWPANPLLTNTFPLPAAFTNSMAAHIEIRGSLAYVTVYGTTLDNSVGGLAIYKVREMPYPVAIDVKPGSYPNCFNINGHGVIPVAVLGSSGFDVADIDPQSLLFAGMAVRIRGNRGPLCAFEDVNGDTFADLVCHFEDQPENWVGGNATATLTGAVFGGGLIEGSDSVCIVP